MRGFGETLAMHSLFNSLQDFDVAKGRKGKLYSLPQLEAAGVGKVSRLPVSIRIVLESVLRNCDGKSITEKDVKALAGWHPTHERTEEIPFTVARVLLQDFTGVPLLVDLAAMRSAAVRMDKDPGIIEPLVPVDLVVDHSIQVDFSNIEDALRQNMEMEFRRNNSRYEFLKWGMQAFKTFKVVPPGVGICHQVNMEYLAQGVLEREGVYYPDTLVGTDSHTTMINAMGVVAWGVGGIEAEAAMLGLPVYILTPDVVGVNLTGKLQPGVTATDLVLTLTELLRKEKVVGKFVEYFGEGAVSLPVTDRAAIANMAPEYGATMGFFPVDEQTIQYYKFTGRSAEHCDLVRAYYQAQGLFGMPKKGDIEYSKVLDLDLAGVRASVAGPKRPQDRITLDALKDKWTHLLQAPVKDNGYGKEPQEANRKFSAEIGVRYPHRPVVGGGEQATESLPHGSGLVSVRNTAVVTEEEMMNNRPTPDSVTGPGRLTEEFPKQRVDIGHGEVVIAAITSCTNTSNPSVMLAAGLLAKKAAERGMKVKPTVKASLAPGSRVVTEYYRKTGLDRYLDELGFRLVGYGCTTCIGNSGPLDPVLENVISKNDVVAASVLSGNRNFEARVHQAVKANFLMSPPLVVAFALAGRVDIDLTKEPLGQGADGKDVFLKDIWPAPQEIEALVGSARDPETYRKMYANLDSVSDLWTKVQSPTGKTYAWNPDSTYIQDPPYFEKFSMTPEPPRPIRGARPLAIFGDSVTTDHISPAGSIKPTSPAGLYLQDRGVSVAEFNSYGSRRGNDRVMVRGTFANVRIKNLMAPGTEGGVTIHYPSGEKMSIYDAAIKYDGSHIPLVILAGADYGMGSSRDWAAKGTALLGVKAVIAASFERIHRSNLVGMGVLPLQFEQGATASSLGLKGSETFDIVGADEIKPRALAKLVVHRDDGADVEVPVRVRIDTPIEVDIYKHGGILPFVLRQIIAASK
ncbi:MAG TPA: aconitate hydratase [Terriglobales bacterium]|nr:aconitate hydratase [Terriglobales bacterium]